MISCFVNICTYAEKLILCILQGIVVNKGNQANVLVHRIADDNLDKNSKTQMLREFDAHVRISKNPHIISLVGLMEEFNVISVAFEYETSTLKSHLVGSRAVQHYPVYAEKNRRFSTLPEGQVNIFSCSMHFGFDIFKIC